MMNKLYLHCSALYNRIIWKLWKKPTVKSIDDTLDYIIEHHCSVSRYGDGEFTVILGIDCTGYQMCNTELRDRLNLILQNPIENHIVCLPDIFGDLSFLKDSSLKFNRGMIAGMGRQWLRLIPTGRVYFNSFFTRCYNMFADKANCPRWFDKNKKIWENQDVLLIEGEKSRLGVGNDLFAGVKSIQRILGPAQNAFEKYNALYDAGVQYGGETHIDRVGNDSNGTCLRFGESWIMGDRYRSY